MPLVFLIRFVVCCFVTAPVGVFGTIWLAAEFEDDDPVFFATTTITMTAAKITTAVIAAIRPQGVCRWLTIDFFFRRAGGRCAAGPLRAEDLVAGRDVPVRADGALVAVPFLAAAERAAPAFRGSGLDGCGLVRRRGAGDRVRRLGRGRLRQRRLGRGRVGCARLLRR